MQDAYYAGYQHTLGAMMKQRRLDNHLTLQVAADRLGVTKETVRLWESGAVIPRECYLTDLAEMLRIPRSDLADLAKYTRQARRDRRNRPPQDWQMDRLTRARHEDMSAIGYRLRQARLEAGITQTDLAYVIGTHASQVCNWEYGRQPVPYDMLAAIADLTGVSVETLTGEADHEPRS